VRNFDLGWKPSAPALQKPKLAYHWERFSAILPEIAPLLHQHYLETGTFTKDIPLNMNFAQYRQLDAAGVLYTLTARDGDKLVGYLVVTVGAHLNFADTAFSTAILYYLVPEYRYGWNGVKLFREWIKASRATGMRVMQVSETLRVRGRHDKRVGVMLRYLGFKCMERSYTQLL
jgi:hypothetical protein